MIPLFPSPETVLKAASQAGCPPGYLPKGQIVCPACVGVKHVCTDGCCTCEGSCVGYPVGQPGVPAPGPAPSPCPPGWTGPVEWCQVPFEQLYQQQPCPTGYSKVAKCGPMETPECVADGQVVPSSWIPFAGLVPGLGQKMCCRCLPLGEGGTPAPVAAAQEAMSKQQATGAAGGTAPAGTAQQQQQQQLDPFARIADIIASGLGGGGMVIGGGAPQQAPAIIPVQQQVTQRNWLAVLVAAAGLAGVGYWYYRRTQAA